MSDCCYPRLDRAIAAVAAKLPDAARAVLAGQWGRRSADALPDAANGLKTYARCTKVK